MILSLVELIEKNDLVWATNLGEKGILYGGRTMGKIITICRRYLIVGTSTIIENALVTPSTSKSHSKI